MCNQGFLQQVWSWQPTATHNFARSRLFNQLNGNIPETVRRPAARNTSGSAGSVVAASGPCSGPTSQPIWGAYFLQGGLPQRTWKHVPENMYLKLFVQVFRRLEPNTSVRLLECSLWAMFWPSYRSLAWEPTFRAAAQGQAWGLLAKPQGFVRS
jgi:hypothetical protein